MGAIRITEFAGTAPVVDPRKLSAGMAADAVDARLEGMDLRTFGAPLDETTYGFPVSRLFRYRWDGQSRWLAWPKPWVVDAVNSPTPGDAFGRLYWTRTNPKDPTADEYPRAAAQPTQANIVNDAGTVRRLGVPAPTNAPACTEKFAPYKAIPEAMSNTSPVTVTTAKPHPFKDGDTVVVKVYQSAQPSTSSGNMAEINGLQFTVSNASDKSFDLLGSDGSHYSKFTDNSDAVIERVYGDNDFVTRSYVYTFVTEWGEEGPPSPPSAPTEYRYDSSIQLDADLVVQAGYGGVNRVRVYRTTTGSAGTSYLFVKEVGTSLSAGRGTLSMLDDVSDASLGESLPSEGWIPPESGLSGLLRHPNGFLIAFKGDTIHFTEPYLPHAWNPGYRMTVKGEIVGIGIFGQALVVATRTKPYIGHGNHPSAFSLQEVDMYAPCRTKASLISAGYGVLYATHDGIALIDGSGPRMATAGMYRRREWSDAFSDSMHAAFYDDRYVLLSSDSKPTLCLTMDGQDTHLVRLSATGSTAALDPEGGTLHVISGTNDNQQYQFDALAPLQAQWTSRIYTQSREVSPAVGRVDASGYPVTLEIGYSEPESAGAAAPPIPNKTYTLQVESAEPFRLPDLGLSRVWQVKVTTTNEVQAVILGESMNDIRAG